MIKLPNSFKIFRTRKRGFTLIELLIVIAIIAILATIIIVNVSSARVKSQTSVAKNTLQTFKKATMLYQNETGKLPTMGSTSNRWCHPGYIGTLPGYALPGGSTSGTGTCASELSPTYIGDFKMDGPYGKCTAATDSYSLCYNYHVYGRNVLFSIIAQPTEKTGPTNIPNFPGAPTIDYCSPSNTQPYYCDGYSY